MLFADIITTIVGLFCTGGVIYLIVDKVLLSKKEKHEAEAQHISNSNDIADLYLKIDEIVEAKTDKIERKLDEVTAELDIIKANWCCYRQQCDDRLTTKPESNG